MKRTLSFIAAALFVLDFSPRLATAQLHFNHDERRIITMTDERRNADSLIGYLSSPDIKVAWRAAIGIANIGDTTVRESLLARFEKEKRDTVADAEAFALGALGPNDRAFHILENAAGLRPTLAKAKAAAQTATPNDFTSAAKVIATLQESARLTHLESAKAFVELAMRKTSPIRMLEDAEVLTLDDNPNVRWRAAFIFARAVDSEDLAIRFDRIKDLLIDQGSPEARMFAATAFGKLHNSLAENSLDRAYRSELDWRVRINILNALAHFPRFDSTINSIYRLAILGAVRGNKFADAIGTTAMQNLEQFVVMGKLSSKDSSSLRSWITEFNGFNGEHDDLEPIVVATATPITVRLLTPNYNTALRTFAQSGDPLIRNIAIRAIGLREDAEYFHDMLESTPMVVPFEQLARLESLDSMWQLAKKDPPFLASLNKALYANIYRHLLIRISDIVNDPAVVTTALEHLKDSTVIFDTAFRAEANKYLMNYLSDYMRPRTRDQLVSSVSAAHWLGMRTIPAIKLLREIADSAISWDDLELLDSTRAALRDAGEPLAIQIPKQRRSTIDWDFLENLPQRWDVNFERSTIQIHLYPYYAPLTCLNMVHLAKILYFSNQKIHRVVPNFVIQSGDPTGTGWGGPGYMIRTEISPLDFDRAGMVGMASSGKDTEGSQWFITESPTPHLDGHYTVWGEVQNGIENVLPIEQGDQLESITTAAK